MSAEKTITKENGAQVVKLRELLKKPQETQELGDVNKWEKASGIEIALLKYLGQKLDAATIERLNREPDAWKAVIAADYFVGEAEKAGNEELKQSLIAMINNPNISAREIGIYATKSLEGTLDKEELDKRLMECHKQAASLKKIETAQKTSLEEIAKAPAKNVIDIVLLPVDEKGYSIYVKAPLLEKNLEKLTVNIHAPGERDADVVDKALMVAKPCVSGAMEYEIKKLERKHSGDIPSYLLFGLIGSVVSSISIAGKSIMVFLAVMGCGFAGSITAECIAESKKEDSKTLKKLRKSKKAFESKASKMLSSIEAESVNWEKNSELSEIYEAACSGKEKIKCKDSLVIEAVESLLEKSEEGKVKVSEPLSAIYKCITGHFNQNDIVRSEGYVKI